MTKVETKPCPQCGAVMYHNQGISKKGKPYDLWKCGACGETEWVSSFPAKPQTPIQQTTKQIGINTMIDLGINTMIDLLTNIQKGRAIIIPEKGAENDIPVIDSEIPF